MSTAVQPTCVCPPDSEYKLAAKINNNLVNLFKLMSAGKWTGNFVNLGSCLCSEALIWAAINNNIVSFFNWFAANGGAALDAQSGIVDLAVNDASKAVVFATQFAGTPSVVCVIAAPDNTGFVISPGIDGGNVSKTGFTALFAAAVPSTGYKMLWIATPTTQ